MVKALKERSLIIRLVTAIIILNSSIKREILVRIQAPQLMIAS